MKALRASLLALTLTASAACAQTQLGMSPLPPPASEFDLNLNGVIEREEAGPLLRPRFAEVDANGSGVLEGGELLREFARQAASRLAGRPTAEPWPSGQRATAQDLHQGLESMVEDLGVSGAALVCGVRGRETFRGHAGEITDTTSVPIASASKWLAGLIVMQAVEAGEVELDTPISAYLPDATPEWGAMTLRQMFSHSAGAPRSHALKYAPDTSAAALAARLMTTTPPAAPGSVFAYGGESMQVGAFAIETRTGRTWRQLFDAGVVGKLGLTQTTYGHPVWYDPGREIATPNVAAGVWSSASDYFRVLSALVSPTPATRLLSDAGTARLEADQTSALPQTYRPPGVLDDWSYGIGLWCERRAGARCSSVSSAGAFGTYPWIDRTTGAYGVLVTLGDVKSALPYDLRLRAMCDSLPAAD